MIYLLLLVAFPLAYTIVMSLQEVTLANIAHFSRPFVGLDNYRAALPIRVSKRYW